MSALWTIPFVSAPLRSRTSTVCPTRILFVSNPWAAAVAWVKATIASAAQNRRMSCIRFSLSPEKAQGDGKGAQYRIMGRMPLRFPHGFGPALFAAGLASIVVHAQPAPAVPDLLDTADNYLVQYSQRLSAIAAEEEYVQYDTSADKVRAPRRLSADVVLFGLADGSIAGFRDVVAIDNAPVHQRDDRLAALFFKADPSASLEQARQLTDDSVKHYFSPNLHALDQPAIALEFLRKANQGRSTFKLESVKAAGEGRVAVLRFTERDTPRLLPITGGGAATGRFWIDVASGTVRQTEVGIASKNVSVRATVKYAQEPALGLWLPVEMSQQIDTSGAGTSAFSNMGGGPGYRVRESLEARATYSKFRQAPIGKR